MDEYDVFISYAHIDNMPLRADEPDSGWVSKFNYVLHSLLSQELGRRAKIWRDPSMDSNTYIWDTIVENMDKSRTFISIVSPSYLNSQWCPRELSTYRERKKPARIGNKSRIFKVFKQPVNQNQISEDLQDLFEEVLATNFFEQEQASGKTRSFNAAYGEKWEQSFYQKIDYLAQEIADLLEEIQPATPAPTVAEEPSPLKPFHGATIYLAEPSPDLWKEYQEIRRDFIKRGAIVLPSLDELKPEKAEEYEAAMRQDLEQSKLVVHFIGSEDQAYSETDPQPLAQRQVNIAAKYQEQFGYTRLIWAPQTVPPADENHRQFITQLSETASRDVDLLRTPLELKTEMERILTGKPKPQIQPAAETAKPTVYLLYDNQDRENYNRLADKLFENGCEVWTVSQTGGADLIEEHKWYLINADAALVFWDKAPTFRVRAMLSELQRIMDNGRENPFRAKGVFIEGDSAEKAAFRTHESLIRSETDLVAFIAQIQAGGQAS